MDWVTIFTGIIALGVLGGFILFLFRIAVKPIELENQIEKNIALMQKDISHIKEDLSNHITDTNKKIEKLETDLKAGQSKLEKDLKEGQKELKDLILKKL